jgi:hypothetical protein
VIDLHDSGVVMMRQSLLRRHPEESAEQIDTRLIQWLQAVPEMTATDPDLQPWQPKSQP